MTRSPSLRLAPALLAVALVGCSSLETRITRPEDQPTTMEMRVEVPGSTSDGSAAVSPSPNVVVESGGSTLNISRVELVLNQVEFRRSDGEGCVDSEEPGQDDGDSCAEVAVQPTILELPVDRDAATTGPVVVPAGTYEGLEFDLQVATASDGNIVNQSPSLVGSSLQVRGSFDDGSGGVELDSAFFSPEFQVQLDLDNPIELGEGFASSMTVTVDVASWFRLENDELVNPSVAARDTSLARQVAENIQSSFTIRAGS